MTETIARQITGIDDFDKRQCEEIPELSILPGEDVKLCPACKGDGFNCKKCEGSGVVRR